ncbi:dihydroorotase [Akkermansia sp. N21116]|jgi:dihydroorotase|uniref:dihydroorotase n=1 Tax=Akkermansia sp. N21116 TaxID=3040764 RepID=UPI00244ECDD5|nr:dihydroorotase [Akkermansia sp. N21116]WPX39268.1 dihydroorotase [Akkermansia sp. N21116]
MEITLDSPLDMHLHLRDSQMLKLVAPLSAQSFAGAVVMPNLVPPVNSAASLHAYRNRVEEATKGEIFQPYMTLFFQSYTEQELASLRPDIFGIKLYPAGATTNSEGGVKAIHDAEGTMKIMEEMGIPLLVHGESHGFVMDREEEFLHVYRHLATAFPKLTICMEHITTASAVQLLDEFENLCATVTLQHLIITLDDVAGGMLRPHLFCKPIAKRPEDRDALLQAALAAHPKLMFGSDSAPHPIHAKEACGCAAGVFTAPIALPVLADLFERHGALEKLQDFVSGNACRLHHLTPPVKHITLAKKDMTVPDVYEGYGKNVVPMKAGETISWSIRS